MNRTYWLLLSIALFIHSGFAHSAVPDDLAEQGLFRTLTAIHTQDWQAASDSAAALAQAFPNFHLLPLLHDLIEQQTSPPFTPAAPLAPTDDEFGIDNLHAELSLRWQSQDSLSHSGMLPASILKLAEHQDYAILVDLNAARLFLLQQQAGQLTVIADYYAGIGKQGVGKQLEGDHRTPVGVYTITRTLHDTQLPELYGVGAWPLDYPNAWDKRMGRTGSGIWLHGVPRTTYSRPPRSSRGCVTLSNPIFIGLQTYIKPGQTPVVLADQVEWLNQDDWRARQKLLLQTIELWRQAWSSRDTEQYLGYYAPSFNNGRNDYAAWRRKKTAIIENTTSIAVTLTEISLFDYPGESDLIQIDFQQQYVSNNFSSVVQKRQYWQQQANQQWRIVYEHAR